jgi:cyclin-dependent kinase 6
MFPCVFLRCPTIVYTRNLVPGAYGTVYLARDSNNEKVALKTMNFALTEDGVPSSIVREISVLMQLKRFEHPNIVR